MDKDEIKKCIYILTGDHAQEKLTNDLTNMLETIDPAVKKEYENKYYKTIRQILSDIDTGEPITKDQRAKLLLKIKNALSEEDRKSFDKFLSIMKLYLATM